MKLAKKIAINDPQLFHNQQDHVIGKVWVKKVDTS